MKNIFTGQAIRTLLKKSKEVVLMSLSLIVVMIKKAISKEKHVESKQVISSTK